jgi:hypothetical protein
VGAQIGERGCVLESERSGQGSIRARRAGRRPRAQRPRIARAAEPTQRSVDDPFVEAAAERPPLGGCSGCAILRSAMQAEAREVQWLRGGLAETREALDQEDAKA